MVWNNSDGLIVKFHRELGTVTKAGEFGTVADGDQHVVEMSLNPLTALTTTAGTVQDQHVIIPANARIEKVEIITVTAATSGGAATLDFGLQRLDRTTELDYDGLIAAAALTTIDTIGETTVLTKGSTGAGALVGTTIGSNAGVLVARYNTAAFTAGALKIKVYWSALAAA